MRQAIGRFMASLRLRFARVMNFVLGSERIVMICQLCNTEIEMDEVERHAEWHEKRGDKR